MLCQMDFFFKAGNKENHAMIGIDINHLTGVSENHVIWNVTKIIYMLDSTCPSVFSSRVPPSLCS